MSKFNYLSGEEMPERKLEEPAVPHVEELVLRRRLGNFPIAIDELNLDAFLELTHGLPDDTRLRVQGLDCAMHRTWNIPTGCPVREIRLYNSTNLELCLHYQGTGVIDQRLDVFRRLANIEGLGRCFIRTARNHRTNEGLEVTWCRLDRDFITFGAGLLP